MRDCLAVTYRTASLPFSIEKAVGIKRSDETRSHCRRLLLLYENGDIN